MNSFVQLCVLRVFVVAVALHGSSLPEGVPTMQEQLVSEPIQATSQAIEPAALARGEPSLPREFRWRDRTFAVTEVLGKWKTTGPCRSGGNEKYVRKHWWKIRTDSGEVMKLYFDRQPKNPSDMKWFLYSVAVPAGD